VTRFYWNEVRPWLFILIFASVAVSANPLPISPMKERNEPPPYERNQVKNTLLREAANPIQNCFKKWSVTNKDFVMGKIQLDWEIKPNGSVRSVRIIHSDIEAINECVKASVAKAKFPSPPQGKPYYVAHKFVFKKVN
jgi:hypothetical protein